MYPNANLWSVKFDQMYFNQFRIVLSDLISNRRRKIVAFSGKNSVAIIFNDDKIPTSHLLRIFRLLCQRSDDPTFCLRLSTLTYPCERHWCKSSWQNLRHYGWVRVSARQEGVKTWTLPVSYLKCKHNWNKRIIHRNRKVKLKYSEL